MPLASSISGVLKNASAERLREDSVAAVVEALLRVGDLRMAHAESRRGKLLRHLRVHRPDCSPGTGPAPGPSSTGRYSL